MGMQIILPSSLPCFHLPSHSVGNVALGRQIPPEIVGKVAGACRAEWKARQTCNSFLQDANCFSIGCQRRSSTPALLWAVGSRKANPNSGNAGRALRLGSGEEKNWIQAVRNTVGKKDWALDHFECIPRWIESKWCRHLRSHHSPGNGQRDCANTANSWNHKEFWCKGAWVQR